MDFEPMMVLGDVSESLSFPPEDLSGLGSIQELRKRGTVRVVVNSYTPGLALRESKDDPIVGLEIDLVRGLTQAMFGTSDVDSHLELIEIDNAMKIDLLADKQVDLIVANLFDTPERRQKIDFAGHYVSARYAPLVRHDHADIERIDDLQELRIAVDAGSEDEATISRLAPSAEVIPMDSPAAWVAAIKDGTVDAFWGDTVVDSAHARNSNGEIKQASLRTGIGHSAVGVGQGSPDLRRFINDFTAHMLSTGQLASSLRRWGL